MTVEELKIEAKKLGYNIIKIPEKVKKLDCICGASSRHVNLWIGYSGMNFKCEKCHRTAHIGRTQIEAIKEWNYSVEHNDFV